VLQKSGWMEREEGGKKKIVTGTKPLRILKYELSHRVRKDAIMIPTMLVKAMFDSRIALNVPPTCWR